jgi:hypothetical protein
MLKGEKSNAPYFSLACSSLSNGQVNPGQTRSSAREVTKEAGMLLLGAGSSNGVGSGAVVSGGGQKVTRRVAHEICEKRKLEEQEMESSKRVKTEGDVNEAVIKELVQIVESEMAGVENDVSLLGCLEFVFLVRVLVF